MIAHRDCHSFQAFISPLQIFWALEETSFMARALLIPARELLLTHEGITKSKDQVYSTVINQAQIHSFDRHEAHSLPGLPASLPQCLLFHVCPFYA